MKRMKVWCASALVFFLSMPLAVLGQSSQGRILGTVTDQNGAAVKNAKIIITNVGTGAQRTVESNDLGDYAAPNLPPGLYSIVAEAGGFKKFEHSDVRVEVAKDVRIDLALTAGNLSEQVSGKQPFILKTIVSSGTGVRDRWQRSLISASPLRSYLNLQMEGL